MKRRAVVNDPNALADPYMRHKVLAVQGEELTAHLKDWRLPISRHNGGWMIVELLRCTFELGLEAHISDQERTIGILSWRSPLVDKQVLTHANVVLAVLDPSVICSFAWFERTTIVGTDDGRVAWTQRRNNPYEANLNDGAGHGVLIAAPRLKFLSWGDTGILGVHKSKITLFWRPKWVSNMDYAAILSGQQDPYNLH